MIWCRPPPKWDVCEGGSLLGTPFFFMSKHKKRGAVTWRESQKQQAERLHFCLLRS